MLCRERADEDNGDEQKISRLCRLSFISVECIYCHEAEQNKSGNRGAHDEIDAAAHSDKGNEQQGSERHPIKPALGSCTVNDDEIDEKFKEHKQQIRRQRAFSKDRADLLPGCVCFEE